MKKETFHAAISAGKEERPVAELVQIANRYASAIYLETENKVINVKSIMGMMTLDLVSGLQMTISAEGEDEEQAVKDLVDYISGK